MSRRSRAFGAHSYGQDRSKLKRLQKALQAIGEHARHFKTITFDNGTEFHDFALLEERFPFACYFATPYHSWERGTNENRQVQV